MKELSIEEKAKRYDEAIERAKSIHNETAIPSATSKGICTYIFPELKESEDERIRNAIIMCLKWLRDEARWTDIYGISFDSIFAWLEKQDEQNTNHKTMIVNFLCKKDWHGIGDYCCGKIYNGYPCEKEQKGYDIYDDNHIPTFCDEDFINEYFNIVTEEKQDEQKPSWSEVDENAFDSILNDLRQGVMPDDEDMNWLKSLKDRYTWKPSDEQIEMLENVRKILHTNKGIYSKANNLMFNFEELIRMLKKLREE